VNLHVTKRLFRLLSVGFGVGIKLPPNNHQTYNNEPSLASAWVQPHRSNKHNLILYVDKELVEKSRDHGVERALYHTDH
jgi:hypothetical protein